MLLKYMFIDLIMFVLGKQNENTEKKNLFFFIKTNALVKDKDKCVLL